MRTRNAVNQTVAFAHATQLLVAGSAQPDNQILAFRGPGGWAPIRVGASLVHSRFGTFLVYGRGDAATYRLVMRSYDRRSGRFRRQRDLRVYAAYSDVAVDARGELQIALTACQASNFSRPAIAPAGSASAARWSTVGSAPSTGYRSAPGAAAAAWSS